MGQKGEKQLSKSPFPCTKCGNIAVWTDGIFRFINGKLYCEVCAAKIKSGESIILAGNEPGVSDE